MYQTKQILTSKLIFLVSDEEIYEFIAYHKDNFKSLSDFMIRSPSLKSGKPCNAGLIRFYIEMDKVEGYYKEILLGVLEKYALKLKIFENENEIEQLSDLFITLAKRGHQNIVKFLLYLGIDVNVTSSNGDTALICVAACGKDLEMAQLLIDAGTNINHQNDLKNSSLSQAIRYNYPEIVKKLLQNSALLLASHLELAISFNEPNLKIIEFLLGYGADFNQEIFEKAQLKSNFSTLEALLQQHEHLRHQARTNPTAKLLKKAIADDYPYIIQLIIESKLEPIDDINDLPLNLVNDKSPESAKILTNYLAFSKFRMLPKRRDLPLELVGYIEKFVHFKKN